MKNELDKQLDRLNEALIGMGALCETAIAKAAKALLEEDASLAEPIHKAEEQIDRQEKLVESICMELLLRHHPVAGDLRQICAALRMITDMERIGDQAADIADICRFAKLGGCADAVHIGAMARRTIQMVSDSVRAYVCRDEALVAAVEAADDLVDDAFLRIKNSLVLMVGAHPEEAENAIDILMVAKYFERIGDHAVNIAQWVRYGLTGRHTPENEVN